MPAARDDLVRWWHATPGPIGNRRDPAEPVLEVLSIPASAYASRSPLLFVHGLGHGAWCWQQWMRAAAEAGHPSYALSLRGHTGSAGVLRRARLAHYVRDVNRVARTLPDRPVLIGHSMGGLIVQQVMARYQARAGVLVASIGHRPAIGSLLSVARQHPVDAAKMVAGMTLPMRREYLFEGLTDVEAAPFLARCGPESPVAQHQLVFHRAPARPLGGAPMLVLGTPQDRLVPIADLRRTAKRYAAPLVEFPGMGHDLMLDHGWERPLATMLGWIDQLDA